MAEVGAVVAAEAVETAAEGAIGAALIVKQPTMPIKARWHKIKTDTSLPRHMHTLSMVKGKVYLFGGEHTAQELASNDVHIITPPPTTTTDDGAGADYKEIKDDPEATPAARAGHTSEVIADRIYVFGGRGSGNAPPLEENGRVWVFDTVLGKWSHIDPMPNTPYPQSRSRHAMTATDHPLPSPAAQEAGAAAVAPHGSLFIQGGSTAKGTLSDTWCFDIAAATWTQYPDGPEPAREGASLTYAGNRLYRYGGRDGQTFHGGQVDFLRLEKTTFDDEGGKAESAVVPKTDKWETVVSKEEEPAPGKRSGAGMHPITTGQGRNFILCILGEGSPNDDNQLHNNVWSYQIQPTGMTGASLKDAARQLVGAKTAEGTWALVDIPEFSKTQSTVERPSPRHGFATAYDPDFDKMAVVLWGGMDKSHEVLGDGWILSVET